MKKKAIPFLGLCLSFLVLACVEEQNFEQADDIAVVPEMEAAMLYMETPEEVINEQLRRRYENSFLDTTWSSAWNYIHTAA